MKKMDFKKQVNALSMETMKPRFSLNEKDLKQIRDWEVGKTYDIVLTVKEVMAHENESGMEATFEVQKAKYEEQD